MNKQNIFITTTLPYVNSKPHMGHAFEFILGDALSRYLKQSLYKIYKVHFNIGLDEHGTKVWEKAKELNIPVETYINDLTILWLEFCTKFDIKYDTFYKTSDASHHEKVKIIWNKFKEKGLIYKKAYVGQYCTGCESFKLDKELVDGKCKDHINLDIQTIEEENYFFKLSAYKDSLSEWLSNSPDFLEPKSKLTELYNLISNTEDISISRLKSNCEWGVSVPDDDTQTIYVWFDALLNYIFAAGYLTDNFHWDYVIQLCGPDNLRFQAIFFQAFLEAEGIKKTDKLLVHGTILDSDGHKMSKSLGNTVDPIEQLEKYNLDAVRYYCLAGLNTYQNCSWNESELINLYNSDICNDWGNLISRTLHLIDTKNVTLVKCQTQFYDIIEKSVGQIHGCWINNDVNGALQKTNELVKYANKYINDTTPWNNEEYVQILSNLYELIKVVNNLYKPVFPGKCEEIENALTEKKKVIIFNKII